MTEFRDLLAEVMGLAEEFSPTTNARMRRRKAALRGMATQAAEWIVEALPSEAELFDLRAEDGGQVGGVSPVAWMRIFSKTKSPSATAGFYAVYLFDAVGDRCFLSLNQGTSEFRAKQWRPISDTQKIIDNASAARFALERAGADISWGSSTKLDLRVQGLRDAGVIASRDPVDRARNYEAGAIVARSYEREAIPSEEVLRTDLVQAVVALVELYGASVEPRADGESAVGQDDSVGRFRGLSRLSAPERRAVELRSMDVTRDFYEAGGWSVVDVSAYRPYDLECTRGSLTLHVEVKGTTASDFRQIELTRNEVDHCRAFDHMELALVSAIRLEKGDDGRPVGAGGELSFVIPWSIEDARLTPLSFAYDLPPSSRS